MVKILKEDTSISLSASNELYQCEECGFKYKEKEWAEKCQEWCKKNNSCNLEIIEHAIEE